MARIYSMPDLDGTESPEEEIRKMVSSFRVHELQHLLGFGNVSKLGKKNELLQRALELVRTSRSLQIQNKVRELYRRRYRSEYPSSDDVRSSQPMPTLYANMLGSCIGGGLNAPNSNNYNASNYNLQTISSSHVDACAAQRRTDAARLLDVTQGACNVSFAHLPFYDVLDTVLKPLVLRPTCQDSTFQDNYLPFSLSRQQAADITYVESATSLPRTEVQLRFCLYDSSTEQKDDFPSGVEVRINEKPVILPNLIPTNKPGIEPKRPSRPVNVTSYCNMSQPQRMHVYWSENRKITPERRWVVGVFIVRRLSSDILLKRLTDKKHIPMETARKMIRYYWSSDNDIATTSLKVSLACPIGKMRMRIPCRLEQCKHLQCFDADLFLRMNEKKPTWMCPVCDKPTPFKDLAVDEYFTDILSQASKDVTEVELLESGDWQPALDDQGSKDDDDDKDDEWLIPSSNNTSTVNYDVSASSKSEVAPNSNSTSRNCSSTNSGRRSRAKSSSHPRPPQQPSTSAPKRPVATLVASSIACKRVGSALVLPVPASAAAAAPPPPPEILIDLTGDSSDEDQSGPPRLIVAEEQSVTVTAAGRRRPAPSLTRQDSSASTTSSGGRNVGVESRPPPATLITLDSPTSGESGTPDDPIDPLTRSLKPSLLPPPPNVTLDVQAAQHKQQDFQSQFVDFDDMLLSSFRNTNVSSICALPVSSSSAAYSDTLSMSVANPVSSETMTYGVTTSDTTSNRRETFGDVGHAGLLSPSKKKPRVGDDITASRNPTAVPSTKLQYPMVADSTSSEFFGYPAAHAYRMYAEAAARSTASRAGGDRYATAPCYSAPINNIPLNSQSAASAAASRWNVNASAFYDTAAPRHAYGPGASTFGYSDAIDLSIGTYGAASSMYRGYAPVLKNIAEESSMTSTPSPVQDWMRQPGPAYLPCNGGVGRGGGAPGSYFQMCMDNVTDAAEQRSLTTPPPSSGH